MKHAIIIPYYNRWDLVHARLMEIYKYINNDATVILINDCSTEKDTVEGAAWWQKHGPLPTLKYYRNKENLGFGGSMNNGAKIALQNEFDALHFLSNDVKIGNNFIKSSEELIKSNCLVGGELLYNNTGWNVLDECGVIPYANGWYLACSDYTWRLLGGFDPIYGKFDYEDVDLSTKAHYLGIEIMPHPDAKFQHMSGSTINDLYPDRFERTKRNQIIWQNKWKDKAQEIKENIYGNKINDPA